MKPRKNPVSYADGLAWSGDAHRITRKYDGEFVGGFRCVVAGVPIIGNAEKMKARSGQRWTASDHQLSTINYQPFHVLTDVSHLDGTDVSRWTLRQRWAELKKLFRNVQRSTFNVQPPQTDDTAKGLLDVGRWTLDVPVILAEEYSDGSALSRVIEAGGEGICAHGWDAPFGADFYAAKHLETFLCVITGFVDGTQSVTIAKAESGKRKAEMGRVPLRGNKIDRVRMGSIIKVEGMGLTPAGRIREPRVCSDTPDSWLVAY